MPKRELTEEQKKADVDLYIIIILTVLALAVYLGFQDWFVTFAKNVEVHILLRTLVMALMQFGVAGLGISAVMLLRKESFKNYGLKAKGTLKSIILSVPLFVPAFLFTVFTGEYHGYFPFQEVWMTRDVLASGFPISVAGMALIVLAWGFFEGFNYVVISEKINTRYPSKNRWLNWGAIICAIMCILIHGVIGVTPESIIEAVTVFIIIYGMLAVKEFTGNAWGVVFLFVFLWNAF